MEEFYPVKAVNCPKEEAAAHSLQKWKGALPENLEKHDVIYESHRIVDKKDAALYFDNRTCSLCFHYEVGADYVECKDCPLYIVRGKVSCCDEKENELDSPYYESKDDPKPMIEWLEKAVEYEKAQKVGEE